MGPAEWGLLVLHSVLWGSGFFFAAVALRELPTATIVAMRLIPACVLFALILAALGPRLPATLGEWGRIAVIGAANSALPMLLVVWAQRHVASGVAAVFVASSPIFTALLAHLLTSDEKLSWLKSAGLATGLAGVAILVGASSFDGSLIAKLVLIVAAICFALAGILARPLAGYHPIAIAAGQSFTAFALSAPLMLIVDQPWTLAWPSWPAAAAVAGHGILGTTFAAICFFTLIRRAGATNAMLVTLLLPLTPTVLGALYLGEVLTLREVVGGLVIAAALLLIDGRLPRRLLGRG